LTKLQTKLSWLLFMAHGVSCFFFHYYIRQGEYVFVVVCLSVWLLATLRENFPTDLHEIFKGRLATDQ